ncbi:MAG: hypothetical protein JWR72_2371 [Flavisolibacter sp.]|jgi:hypothetical protein|nr:hypothetical protein [Flavisolibacter sp.]
MPPFSLIQQVIFKYQPMQRGLTGDYKKIISEDSKLQTEH